jgi:hypothetical protein
MRKRIIRGPGFDECVTALGSPDAATLVRALAHRIAEDPSRGFRVSRTDIYMRGTRSTGDHPAIRLYYSFYAGHDTVYLLHVERYDELSP